MGKTILISSHILLELADLCNKVGIIEQGMMQYVGTVDDIMARAKVDTVVHVGIANRIADALTVCKTLPGVQSAEMQNSHIRVTLDQEGDVSIIAQQLVTGGFKLTRLEEEKVNLETAFMRLTKGLVQ